MLTDTQTMIVLHLVILACLCVNLYLQVGHMRRH